MAFDVNHTVLYPLAAIVIVFVLGQSVFFLYKARKRALELGIERRTIRRIAAGSALFTIAPAIGILLGLFSLARFLGVPLPWLRLSVLGALTYELPAAAAVAKILGLPLDRPVTDPAVYVEIAWVMTLGIMSGILIILFLQKRMQARLQRIRQKDTRWSRLLMDSLFVGMIATFLGMVFADINKGLRGWIPVFVMCAAAVLMVLFGLAVKRLKWAWLENYAMPLSMLGAMAFAIPLTAWIGG